MEAHYNDPNTKYSQGDLENSDKIVFFNYHEFLINEYQSLSNDVDPKADDGLKISIVVNHFPNPYVARDSELFQTTRVVRIPRIFDQVNYLYMIPQFSTYVPGDEPAAIKGASGVAFVPYGEYDGTVFGETSSTPLVPNWISQDELRGIIQRINSSLQEAISPEVKWNWLDNVLDFFSATLYSRLFTNNVRNTHMKRKIGELENYVEDVNANLLSKRDSKLRLISPVESAFLSLDFQIPKPVSDASSTLQDSEKI